MMHKAILIGAAAAMANAAALPVPSEQFFTIPQVHPKPLPVGPIAMSNTYAKYGKSHAVPADVKAAAAAAQTGTVEADNQPYDSSYLSPVNVGGTTLNLDFDTGSSDLWVFSSSLSASTRSGHSYYKNTGTRQSGETWQIQYGDGSGASGVVYSDKVVIGGVTATSQAVEAATSVSQAFAQDASDGLVGLALQSINTCSPRQCSTFMTTVGSSLKSNLFAATLKKGQAGSYDFGYIDSSKYSGSIAYTSIDTSNGFWEFDTTGYAIGTGSQTSSSIDVIADTGTSLIYLPDSVVSAYYKKVSGSSYSSSQGGYTFPCSATLPSFSVYFAGAKHTVPGSYLNYAPISTSTCFGAIQSNSGLGLSILGDSFLKSQYVVFDVGNSRIGFAQQAGVSA